jgi:hypothetical protein
MNAIIFGHVVDAKELGQFFLDLGDKVVSRSNF